MLRSKMTIRKATKDDADAIATHLLLAMEELVYTFIGIRDYAKAKELMLHFTERERNQYSYQNCWVAANEEGVVVAAVNVYDGAHLHALRQPVIDYITNHYARDFKPEDETQAGEFYIDTLGVHPDQQGKGIGTQLLEFLIDEYVRKRGKTVGLLVDEENPNAKRLYLKLGFKCVGKKVLVGKRLEHLQIKGSANPA